ncbi:MAG TPA: carbohydrate ABC transporter permease [Candidatus Enteromonas pullicola]|uniref:Carbohydrate ABC transporter permease n=1 Tax=Candidatus Alloenteromonas pullicola TaxID=2840784 RepID=A0A9D1S289_9FIRM|nr:carbohydrate ABC transporter permease [Candidatus Enteromonas pullicola]
MSGIVLGVIVAVCALIGALVAFDVAFVSLKKGGMRMEGRFGSYVSSRLIQINCFVILTLFCIFWMLPLVIGVLGSLTSQYSFTYAPGHLIPEDGFTFDNYLALFNQHELSGERIPVERWILNSFLVATVNTFLYLLIAGFAAYAFVFLRFKFRNVVFLIIIFTMVIPGIATMAPQLSNIANLGISKSLWALILPGLGGVGGLYLIRQFYLSIPVDLIESARIDGASDFRIFFKIVFPLAKTVFLVQGLFCFMGSWNDLFWPQIVIGTTNKELWTLPVGVAYLSSSKTANAMGLSLASAIFSAFPIFILYLFTQNKIIEGVAATGVKR